jgi:hypothetical protein
VPVVDEEGRFEGTVSLESLKGEHSGDDRPVGAIVDTTAPTVSEGATLDVAVEALTTASQHWVAVLDGERNVVGTMATSDVVRGYRLGLLASLQQLNADAGSDSTDRIPISPGSPLVDRHLRDARLPPSVIITTIQRNRDLVVPNGNTLLGSGDELVVIGTLPDIAVTRDLAQTTRASSPVPPSSNGKTNAQTQHPLPSDTRTAR